MFILPIDTMIQISLICVQRITRFKARFFALRIDSEAMKSSRQDAVQASQPRRLQVCCCVREVDAWRGLVRVTRMRGRSQPAAKAPLNSLP